MKSEIEPVHRLLSKLLAHPCQTRAEFAAWKELAEQLKKAMSDSWEWTTDAEFQGIQHYISDIKGWGISTKYRQWQRAEMADLLRRLQERESEPDQF